MSTKRGALTWGAVIGKSAPMLPAGIVTLAGKHGGVTNSPSMLPHTHTATPPVGAGAVNVTVPVVAPPPRMRDEARVRDARLGAGAGLPGGTSVSELEGARNPSKPVPESMTTWVGMETGLVTTSNVA